MSSKKETEINGFNTIRKANINVKQLKGLFAAEPSPPPVKPAPKGARSPKSPAPVQNQSNIRSFAVGKTEIRIEETKTPSSTPKSQGPKTPTTPKAPPETKPTSNIPKQSIEEDDDHSKSVQDKIAKFRALQQDANSVRQMQRVPSRQTSSSSSTAAPPSPLSNVKVNSWDDDSYQPPVVITDNNYGASQTYNGGVTESQEDHGLARSQEDHGLARSQEDEKDRYEESPIQENGNHVSHLEENYSNDQETHSNGQETYSNGQEDYYQQVTNHDNEDDYQGQQTYGSSNYEEERREELAEERREELAEEIVSHVQNDDDGGSATYQYQDNSHEYSEINNLEDDGQYQEQQHQEHFNSEQEQEEQRDEIQEEHPIISHLEHEEHNNNEIEENSSEINSYAEHEVAENHENESPQYE